MIFCESPTRRVDYLSITTCDIFPKEVCSRWVVNVDVCQWALDVSENLKTYVKCSKLPDNFTVNTVKDAVNDLLMPTEISFFQCITLIAETFFRIFQSDGPLALFLYQELKKVMRWLMQNFIKADMLTEAKSTYELMKIKCNRREVNIGIATPLLLAKIRVTESHKS